MSRRSGTTITVDAEVHISEFDDDVVLEAAIQAVVTHKGRAKPTHPDQVKYWEATDSLVERLAKVLGINTRPDLPPASTAAGVTSMEHLRALCGRAAP